MMVLLGAQQLTESTLVPTPRLGRYFKWETRRIDAELVGRKTDVLQSCSTASHGDPMCSSSTAGYARSATAPWNGRLTPLVRSCASRCAIATLRAGTCCRASRESTWTT